MGKGVKETKEGGKGCSVEGETKQAGSLQATELYKKRLEKVSRGG